MFNSSLRKLKRKVSNDAGGVLEETQILPFQQASYLGMKWKTSTMMWKAGMDQNRVESTDPENKTYNQAAFSSDAAGVMVS